MHLWVKNILLQTKARIICSALICFFGTFMLSLALFAYLGYAPFGNNGLCTMDAYIQYLDFLSYYRDVLKGNNNIVFSNSIGLGQTGIGTFSYYLASPLNFLLPLFKKENMFSFFNLTAAIKWSLAAASMDVFLHFRYRERLAIPFSWLLSLS